MKKTILIALAGMGLLVGCATSPSAVGTWTSMDKNQTITLNLSKKGRFYAKNENNIDVGHWDLHKKTGLIHLIPDGDTQVIAFIDRIGKKEIVLTSTVNRETFRFKRARLDE